MGGCSKTQRIGRSSDTSRVIVLVEISAMVTSTGLWLQRREDVVNAVDSCGIGRSIGIGDAIWKEGLAQERR
jgi:hypothetical protein